uniref:Uncharacterized protein n=1 Tax=Leersia perrieri TaxID=77586 RepID=A0A0D9WFX9_9ORYZ
MTELLSALLPALLKKAGESLSKEFSFIWGIERRRSELYTLLLAINQVIFDAEEQASKSRPVKSWITQLKLAAYDVDNALDELHYEALRSEALRRGHKINSGVRAFSSPHYNPLLFKYKIGKRLQQIVEQIDKLVSQMNSFGFLKCPIPVDERIQTISCIDEQDVIGREKERDEILNILVRAETDKLLILPIVGIGGLGKTTLAQLVFNDVKVKAHFEKHIWVCVSEVFSIPDIVKKIIDTAIGNDCALKNDNLELLQQRLQGELRQKRYLLVLDDVWNEDEHKWEALRTLIGSCGMGSAVVVTTRSMKVAKITQIGNKLLCLNNLSPEDSWVVFRTKAFGAGVVKTSELVECFAFCAVFPKDYEIDKDDLIHLWIANGFILSENTSDIVETGNHVFWELVWRSFFQNVEQPGLLFPWKESWYGHTDVTTCKIHDLMHDLAVLVSGEECFALVNVAEINEIPENVHHLIFPHPHKIGFVMQHSPIILSVFSLYKNHMDSVQEIKFKKSLLRVVGLHIFGIERFPVEPAFMKHLRYLDLSCSHIKTLSEAVSALYNLQVLMLNRCSTLTHLPNGMKFMISLRHVYREGCSSLEMMPPGLGNLIFLRTLSKYIVDKASGCGLKEIKDLKLGGKLKVYNLMKVTDPTDVLQLERMRELKCLCDHQLVAFPKLRALTLDQMESLEYWQEYNVEQVTPFTCPALDTMKIIDCPKLATMPRVSMLKSLSVTGNKVLLGLALSITDLSYLYLSASQGGSRRPHILARGGVPKFDFTKKTHHHELQKLHRFSCLKHVSIWDSSKLESIPEGWDHQDTLQSLVIGKCPRLKSLPASFQFLSNLTTLDLAQNHSLTSLPDGMQNLTVLKSLYITKCPGINVLPEGLQQRLDSLESFTVEDCPALARRCKRGGDYWDKVKDIPDLVLTSEQRSAWRDAARGIIPKCAKAWYRRASNSRQPDN